MKTTGGFLISQIRQLQGRVFAKMLRESGVDAFNGPQGRILYVLWENEPLSITEISRLTSLAKTSLTSMLDRMEEAGLLHRVPNAKNRRQVLISLTPLARGYREQYDAVSQRMNRLFYAGFSADEVERFEHDLNRIIDSLQKEEDTP